MKQRLVHLFKQILDFLTNKQFILNLIGLIAFVLIVIFGVLQWLKFYTHHGQKLSMPDYINVPLRQAVKDAKDKSFEIIVNDSVHIVEMPGGIIRLQNPKGGSLVKQNRKIYVTVTKYLADKVDLADLYDIYGANYNLKAAEFRTRGLKTRIKETKYDPADNVILEVWQGDRQLINREEPPPNILVDKGSILDFVVSSSAGGSFVVADVRGKTVNQARFALRKFRIGDIRTEDGSMLQNVENAIIVEQDPPAESVGESGQLVHLVVRDPS